MDARGTLTYYTDTAGERRWRLTSPNGNIVAVSGEGYKRLADAVNGFHAVCNLVGGNPAALLVEFQE